jgi:hypothetical protein
MHVAGESCRPCPTSERLVYTFVVVPGIVVIGPAEALASLRTQVANGAEVQTFTDYQVREAVEYIATHKPAVVAVEQEFAVSPRGEALVGRIVDDPSLTECEIRILGRSVPKPEKARKKSGAGITPAATVAPAPAAEVVAVSAAIDRRGTRRAERVRLLAGVSVTVDGNPAELIDLSAVGAQVLSKMILRPNQRVRLQLLEGSPDDRRALRCSGSVVWAAFEMPAGQPPRYRAGLRITGGEGEAVQGFADRHRAAAAPLPSSDEAS